VSGGSFHYLYSKVDDGGLRVAEHRDTIKAMAAELAALGGAEDAAEATAQVVAMIDEFTALMEQRAEALRDAWRAMEWLSSGDWGPERLDAALAEYRRHGGVPVPREWTIVLDADHVPYGGTHADQPLVGPNTIPLMDGSSLVRVREVLE